MFYPTDLSSPLGFFVHLGVGVVFSWGSVFIADAVVDPDSSWDVVRDDVIVATAVWTERPVPYF